MANTLHLAIDRLNDREWDCSCEIEADHEIGVTEDDEYDDDYDWNDDSDGLTDAQADAMTLASAYGGDWWDM